MKSDLPCSSSIGADGFSGSQVAQKLGGFENYKDQGRNAVLGQVHKLERETEKKLPHGKAQPREAKPSQVVSPKKHSTDRSYLLTNNVVKIPPLKKLRAVKPAAGKKDPEAEIVPFINRERRKVLRTSEERSPFPTPMESGLTQDEINALASLYR